LYKKFGKVRAHTYDNIFRNFGWLIQKITKLWYNVSGSQIV
jgi:hypothetical protein